MPQYVTIQLENREAFFLSRLMNMQEMPRFSNPHIKDWAEVKQQLVADGLLIEDGGELIIDRTACSMLQTCKLSSFVARLYLEGHGAVSEIYYYLTSESIIELEKQADISLLTAVGGMDDYMNIIGNRLEAAEDTTDMRASVSAATYEQLAKELAGSSEERVARMLIEKEKMLPFVAKAFAHSWKNAAFSGEYKMLAKAKDGWESKSMRFITSESGNWLLLPHKQRFEIFNVSDMELVEAMFLLTVSVLQPD
ncbi:MAG: hypothetical protein ACE3JP_04190 [Ectobacillus sp.]